MKNSVTNKFVGIIVIVLCLAVVLTVISGTVAEREYYSQKAKQRIADSWTASQRVVPFVIAIPYRTLAPVTGPNVIGEKYINRIKLVAPNMLNVSSELQHSTKSIGIFTVPVYTASIQIDGRLNRNFLRHHKAMIKSSYSGEKIEFNTPFVISLISDVRGISRISALQWNDDSIEFAPGNQLFTALGGVHAMVNDELPDEVTFSYELELRGMETLSVVPTGLETQMRALSKWPHPQFSGDFLPISSSVNDNGYNAEWRVSSYASNIEDRLASCNPESCDALIEQSVSISHIEPIDIYTQTDRSVKYGVLFIGLCFAVFVLFELFTKNAIHPVQYALVGLANVVFYLLLLSLSEHIYFSVAYVIGVVGCVGLLYLYLKPILQQNSYLYGLVMLLTVLYAILYFIINMEDTALLAGSALSFIILTVIMMLTRQVDWYAVNLNSGQSESESTNSEH